MASRIRRVDIGVVKRQGTLDERVDALAERQRQFPNGNTLPPHLHPLLAEASFAASRQEMTPFPEWLLPFTRETPSPLHPLFPNPGPFPTDPLRYFRQEESYKHSLEEQKMNNVSPTYVTDAPGEKAFFCANGETYRNLRELHGALLTMKDEHFRHHVSEQKNDFASWVRDVFADHQLAKDLGAVRSRALSAYKVGQRLRHTSSRRKV